MYCFSNDATGFTLCYGLLFCTCFSQVYLASTQSVTQQQQERETGIETGQAQDPEAGEAGGSSGKLKTAMKSIIKTSAFDRAMKVEAELNRLHGRIIKQLDSMKSYEMEQQRLQLEERKLNMLRKAAINIIKRYKERAESKRAMSKIMFDCLLNSYFISNILEN